MQPDDCSPTSKDDRSPPNTSPEEALWERMKKPYRQQNLTPSQRSSLAMHLRALRRARSAGMLDGSHGCVIDLTPFVTTKS